MIQIFLPLKTHILLYYCLTVLRIKVVHKDAKNLTYFTLNLVQNLIKLDLGSKQTGNGVKMGKVNCA